MSVADEIMPYIVKTLESHLELNEMGQCIKVMSVFARNKAIRKKMLMYKQDVLMAKLLKKIFDFSQLMDNETVIDLITFFSVVAEEEF